MKLEFHIIAIGEQGSGKTRTVEWWARNPLPGWRVVTCREELPDTPGQEYWVIRMSEDEDL